MANESTMTNKKPQPTFSLRQILIGLEGIAIIIACYLTFFLKPWRDVWGTTQDKNEEVFHVDEFIPNPSGKFTHAIFINAPVNEIWPWIAQIGQGRGGFYSYEALENIAGLQIYNASEILDEFQNLQLGDRISFGAGTEYPIIYLEPPHSMAIAVWYDRDLDKKYDPTVGHPSNFLQTTWLWHIESISPDQSRLYSRNRLKLPTSWKNKILAFFMEPVVFAVDRKMLLGIKKRAERTNQ